MSWVLGELPGTVQEFENFSYGIQYYDEGIVDPVTGLTGEKVDYTVTITQLSPQATVTTSSGITATVAGFYRYIFYDTVIYKNFNNEILTIQGTENLGTWEQIIPAEVYQIIEFIPDATRFRTFNFLAEAKSSTGAVVATTNFIIDVSDRNWDPGKAALQNIVAIIKSRLE